jgi:hypothetical protein
MKFKIRASAVGKIMTNSKKKGELSKTTLSYVDEWLKSKIYGVNKDISSKYTEKGHRCEDNAIDFVSDQFGEFMIKNEEYFQNDFLTGTPDIITKDEIIDIKNSWDCFTFPLFEKELPNKDYYYQLQAYMYLTGKRKAKVVYVLMDTPEDLLGYYNKVVSYQNIDSKYRIKVFEVEYSEEVIKAIRERVNEIQEYINKLLNKVK